MGISKGGLFYSPAVCANIKECRTSILFANMKKSLTIIYTSYNVCNIILKVINTITETM